MSTLHWMEASSGDVGIARAALARNRSQLPAAAAPASIVPMAAPVLISTGASVRGGDVPGGAAVARGAPHRVRTAASTALAASPPSERLARPSLEQQVAALQPGASMLAVAEAAAPLVRHLTPHAWRSTPLLRETHWLCTQCNLVLPQAASVCTECKQPSSALTDAAGVAESQALAAIMSSSAYGRKVVSATGKVPRSSWRPARRRRLVLRRTQRRCSSIIGQRLCGVTSNESSLCWTAR